MKEVTGYQDYEMNDEGQIFNKKTGHQLSPRKCTTGYMKVTIMLNKGDSRTEYVHRLIGKTLLDYPGEGYQINHIDGVKDNNSPSNLEWVTGKQNVAHAIALGLIDKRKAIVAKNEDGYEYEFDSINECAKYLVINRRSIHHFLKTGHTTKTGYTFKAVK